ncbi:MAG: hypothetical protein ACR2LX_15895 [Jatrophihabitans sp.]
MRRFAALLATGLLLGAVTVETAVSPPATAAPVSSCSTSRGVLVVVDFRHFGGNITRGCAVNPSSGYGALHAAGFETTGTVHDGPGFVCRIDGQPSSYPCVQTPPARAYWSYWHAGKGNGSWSYSQQGAQESAPGNGSVDAWVFGATDVGGSQGGPSFTPAQVRAGPPASGASNPPAPRTTYRRAAGHGDTTAAQAPQRSVAQQPASTSGAPRSASTPARKTATHGPGSSAAATSSAASSASSSNSAPLIVDATPASSQQKSRSGSVTPVVLGLALVVLLGLGAGWTVWRRRRTDAGS